ncbi:hypothetical protein MRB53_039481 [Persea americana]|nr:hypothetical protein MRB53_039481 [Persea americana]
MGVGCYGGPGMVAMAPALGSFSLFLVSRQPLSSGSVTPDSVFLDHGNLWRMRCEIDSAHRVYPGVWDAGSRAQDHRMPFSQASETRDDRGWTIERCSLIDASPALPSGQGVRLEKPALHVANPLVRRRSATKKAGLKSGDDCATTPPQVHPAQPVARAAANHGPALHRGLSSSAPPPRDLATQAVWLFASMCLCNTSSPTNRGREIPWNLAAMLTRSPLGRWEGRMHVPAVPPPVYACECAGSRLPSALHCFVVLRSKPWRMMALDSLFAMPAPKARWLQE